MATQAQDGFIVHHPAPVSAVDDVAVGLRGRVLIPVQGL
jgi:hypothetical protein